jgi:hypothetical protein
MFDFLKTVATPPISARDVVIRLLGAMVLGLIVAWVYRRTRPRSKTGASMQGTLVLLAILIAIVTQVVGESAARAFSLVGALSIVRFRTVVQDTQDTAFVIFAVVMGMAAGAGAPWMAVIGLVVVSSAAFVMRPRGAGAAASLQPAFVLNLRVGLGQDVDALLNSTLDAHLIARRLLKMETARQGTAIEVVYEIQFRPDGTAEGLLKALNRLEGVQNVQLQDADFDDD